jgi:hypothetical protein
MKRIAAVFVCAVHTRLWQNQIPYMALKKFPRFLIFVTPTQSLVCAFQEIHPHELAPIGISNIHGVFVEKGD